MRSGGWLLGAASVWRLGFRPCGLRHCEVASGATLEPQICGGVQAARGFIGVRGGLAPRPERRAHDALAARDFEATQEEDADGSCGRWHRLRPFHRTDMLTSCAEVRLLYFIL